MKNILCLVLLTTTLSALQAQEHVTLNSTELSGGLAPLPRLKQRNYGAIIGIQRGRTTAVELGGEMHWRKIGLRKPHIWGATANMEYSFGEHIVGYKAGVWRKQGRVNLTYGANVAYFNNFEGGHQFGIGPAVGFRLFGLHLVNGINILTGDMRGDEPHTARMGANTLYMSLRYYFPLQNKFVWDRKHKKGDDNNNGFLGLGRKEEPERKGLFGRRLKKEKPERARMPLFRKRTVEQEQPRQQGLKRLFGRRQD